MNHAQCGLELRGMDWFANPAASIVRTKRRAFFGLLGTAKFGENNRMTKNRRIFVSVA